jgi:hypothetical protein
MVGDFSLLIYIGPLTANGFRLAREKSRAFASLVVYFLLYFANEQSSASARLHFRSPNTKIAHSPYAVLSLLRLYLSVFFLYSFVVIVCFS